MNQIKNWETKICPKCGKKMDTRRNDAKQCRSCRRKQQSDTGNMINTKNREIESNFKLKERSLSKIKPILIDEFSEELKDPELYKKDNESLLDRFQNPLDYTPINILGQSKKDIIKLKKMEFESLIDTVKRRINSTSS